MFRKILVPTDGSTLSDLAITNAIRFAKAIGASVYGFHAAPDYAMPVHGVDLYSSDKFRAMADNEARNYLAGIEGKAKEAGVPCTTGFTVSVSPYRAIVDAAKEQNCDLIFMASHGRRGLAGLLLGSETQKVLTHCHIPVLVYRDKSAERSISEAMEAQVNTFRT
jgi:nucleotide-binding universal stress UspA family protein